MSFPRWCVTVVSLRCSSDSPSLHTVPPSAIPPTSVTVSDTGTPLLFRNMMARKERKAIGFLLIPRLICSFFLYCKACKDNQECSHGVRLLLRLRAKFPGFCCLQKQLLATPGTPHLRRPFRIQVKSSSILGWLWVWCQVLGHFMWSPLVLPLPVRTVVTSTLRIQPIKGWLMGPWWWSWSRHSTFWSHTFPL